MGIGAVHQDRTCGSNYVGQGGEGGGFGADSTHVGNSKQFEGGAAESIQVWN